MSSLCVQTWQQFIEFLAAQAKGFINKERAHSAFG